MESVWVEHDLDAKEHPIWKKNPIGRCITLINGAHGSADIVTKPTFNFDADQKVGNSVEYNGLKLDIDRMTMDDFLLVPVFILEQLFAAHVCMFVKGVHDSVVTVSQAVKHDPFHQDSLEAVRSYFASFAPPPYEGRDTVPSIYEAAMRLVMMVDASTYTFKNYLLDVALIAGTTPTVINNNYPFGLDANNLLQNKKVFDEMESRKHLQFKESMRRRGVLDDGDTVYFISDIEGRFHIVLGCLLKLGVIRIDDDLIKWLDPHVWVVHCGDATDDTRWIYSSADPMPEDLHDKAYENLIGRDLDALFVLDYLRRISNGRFINIVGNHDLENFRVDGNDQYFKFNIKGLYPNAKYAVANGEQCSRSEFIQKYVIPFYSMNFIYVLETPTHDFILSHAGVSDTQSEKIQNKRFDTADDDLIEHFHRHMHTRLHDKSIITDDDNNDDTSVLNLYSRRYDKRIECTGDKTVKDYAGHDIDCDAVLRVLDLNYFIRDEVDKRDKRSTVQVMGHNKDHGSIRVIKYDGKSGKNIASAYVNGIGSVDLHASDSEVVFCMVDALTDEKSPATVQVLKYTNNNKKLEVIAPAYNDGGKADELISKFSTLIESTLYRVDKGDPVRPTTPP